MKLNRRWRQNQCLEGEHCNFAHGDHELRVLPPDLVTQLEPSQPKPKEEQPLLKTKLCSKFINTGHCPYGDKCIFAHGTEELRARPQPGAPPPRPPPAAPSPHLPVSKPLLPAAPSVPPPRPPPPPDPSQASYLDTVRALCAMLRVGRLSPQDVTPEAQVAAVLALQSGRALRASAYADGIDLE